jgi:hypothetical protein
MPINDIQGLISAVGSLVLLLLPISAAIAFLIFFWGLADFILHSDDEKTHEEGKNRMIWGVIILFVIVSIWGIIGFFQGDFFGGPPVNTVQIQTR